MSGGLFSTYRGGENRVTASILAVLRSLALERIERLLGALTEEAEFELVTFTNQSSQGGTGVPDAEVASSCRILVETKITRNAVRVDQLERHLRRLDSSKETFQCLLVLTPDEVRPVELERLDDERVSWASFSALDQAIDELLVDKTEVVSEREAFLLRELQLMLVEEHLLGFAKDTVIVAARHAWLEYQELHAYVCQPGRPFQPVQYMGFYSSGQIFPLIPRILEVHDRVLLEKGPHEGRLGNVVNRLLDSGSRRESSEQKVFLLSAPDDPQTVRLKGSIVNDLRSASGRVTAFTQGQRYVRSEDLTKATRTSELRSAEAD